LRENDANLLPPHLSRSAAETGKLYLRAHGGRRAAGRFSAMLALPSGELARSGRMARHFGDGVAGIEND
jgi:hypothetical protein